MGHMGKDIIIVFIGFAFVLAFFFVLQMNSCGQKIRKKPKKQEVIDEDKALIEQKDKEILELRQDNARLKIELQEYKDENYHLNIRIDKLIKRLDDNRLL